MSAGAAGCGLWAVGWVSPGGLSVGIRSVIKAVESKVTGTGIRGKKGWLVNP